MKRIYIIALLGFIALVILANYYLPVIDSYMKDGSGYRVSGNK
jgi:hypothetical protein